MFADRTAVTARSRLLQRFAAGSALLALGLFAVPVAASEPASPPPAWEQLSPEQQERLIAPIRDRWNAQPEAREAMLDHARRWQELTPEQRRRASHGRHRWEHMNPEQREQARALFKSMKELPPEQRKALREQWHSMTPEQRREWIEKHSKGD
ncbi:DUF3106 domain-containing protein [Marilutibacter alkalisoli]|uniref:DUF3106 domain-containing protein n=1 Tax=Marilutibacter alkalisoli TaxID=2591633 RepID=A0A514BTK7_9GAMM|nr:DUF3106 domain-containing protein [Lysobacter alkalisoli]QDH70741.1 DUF3106 domain-containing protein [Lysobacter alkalisoli]